MSDISKIKLSSGTYNLKDNVARDQSTTNKSKIEHLEKNKIVYMIDYVTPDGNSDNTSQMQKAIDDSEGGTLIINKQENIYRCSLLQLKANTTYIFEQGVTVKANDTWVTSERWQSPLIDIRNVENVKLYGNGATITMNKPETLATEHAHCMGTRGAKNVYVESFTLSNASGDGFYIDQFDGDTSNTPSSFITIKNIICDNNGRQGLSIVNGHNIIIENSIFRNTKGKAPQCGIDIELEARSLKGDNILINNCVFDNNAFSGVLIAANYTNPTTYLGVNITNCTFSGGSHGVYVTNIKDGSIGAITVSNCTFKYMSRCGILDGNNVDSGIKRIYSNINILNPNQVGATQVPGTSGELGWGCGVLIFNTNSQYNGNIIFNNVSVESKDSKCISAFGYNGRCRKVRIVNCHNEGCLNSFNGDNALLFDVVVTGLHRPKVSGDITVTSANYYCTFTNGTVTLGEINNIHAVIDILHDGAITKLNRGSRVIQPINKFETTLTAKGSRIQLQATSGAINYNMLNAVYTDYYG